MSNPANRARRRRLRLWMRLMQRTRAWGCGGRGSPAVRRGHRYWTRDYDLLGRIDPVVQAERQESIRASGWQAFTFPVYPEKK